MAWDLPKSPLRNGFCSSRFISLRLVRTCNFYKSLRAIGKWLLSWTEMQIWSSRPMLSSTKNSDYESWKTFLARAGDRTHDLPVQSWTLYHMSCWGFVKTHRKSWSLYTTFVRSVLAQWDQNIFEGAFCQFAIFNASEDIDFYKDTRHTIFHLSDLWIAFQNSNSLIGSFKICLLCT